MQEAEEWKQKLLQSQNRNNVPGWSESRAYLAFIRSHPTARVPALAYKAGHALLLHNNTKNHKTPSGLGDEVWTLYEQTLLACLEVNDLPGAEACLKALTRQFGPESSRIRKLYLQYQVAMKDFDRANDLAKTLIELDPSDQFVLKRRITLKKELGRPTEAIALLIEYLQVFMADTEAWQELADLYLSAQSYKNAAFCYEELIAAFPQVHHYYVTYAEILYTLGGENNTELARKYFAFSLELTTENNTRGFYGLLMATQALASMRKGNTPNTKLNAELNSFAQDKLGELYAKEGLQALPFRASALDTIGKLTAKASE